MKHILLTIIFTMLVNAQSGSLTLEESFKLCLENSTEIKIAEKELAKMKEKQWEVTSQMLPKLSFNASYTRMSETPEAKIALPGMPQPYTFMESIPNRYNLSLRFEQPIFTGFRLSSLKSSVDYQITAAEIQLSKKINEQKLAVTKAFWSFAKTQNLVNLLTGKIIAFEEHLKNTRAFVNNGLATQNDLLQLEVQYSNLKIKLTEANNLNTIARTVFNKTIGLDIFNETTISASTSVLYEFTDEEIAKINDAAILRNEVKQIDLNILSSDEMITAARADYLPNIIAFGDYYYSRPNQQIFPMKDKFDDTWDVGVGLKWNLWDWGNTSSKVAQNKYVQEQLKLSRTELLNNIKIEIYSKYLEAKKLIEKYELVNTSILSAQENLRILEKKYAAHLVTSAEIIDAENLLLEAETNRDNTIADFAISLAEYYNSIGKDL